MVTVSNIANASQGELLCITYKLFMDHMKKAMDKTGIDKEKHVETGIEIIKHLAENLNFEVAISSELFQIYVYVQKLLINYKYEKDNLKEAYNLIQIIYKGYEVIVEQEVSRKPAMQNTENIYAGITYGKGTLNEMTMPNTNRGFKA